MSLRDELVAKARVHRSLDEAFDALIDFAEAHVADELRDWAETAISKAKKSRPVSRYWDDVWGDDKRLPSCDITLAKKRRDQPHNFGIFVPNLVPAPLRVMKQGRSEAFARAWSHMSSMAGDSVRVYVDPMLLEYAKHLAEENKTDIRPIYTGLILALVLLDRAARKCTPMQVCYESVYALKAGPKSCRAKFFYVDDVLAYAEPEKPLSEKVKYLIRKAWDERTSKRVPSAIAVGLDEVESVHGTNPGWPLLAINSEGTLDAMTDLLAEAFLTHHDKFQNWTLPGSRGQEGGWGIPKMRLVWMISAYLNRPLLAYLQPFIKNCKGQIDILNLAWNSMSVMFEVFVRAMHTFGYGLSIDWSDYDHNIHTEIVAMILDWLIEHGATKDAKKAYLAATNAPMMTGCNRAPRDRRGDIYVAAGVICKRGMKSGTGWTNLIDSLYQGVILDAAAISGGFSQSEYFFNANGDDGNVLLHNADAAERFMREVLWLAHQTGGTIHVEKTMRGPVAEVAKRLCTPNGYNYSALRAVLSACFPERKKQLSRGEVAMRKAEMLDNTYGHPLYGDVFEFSEMDEEEVALILKSDYLGRRMYRGLPIPWLRTIMRGEGAGT